MRKYYVFVAILALVLLIAGCSDDEEGTEEETEETETETEETEDVEEESAEPPLYTFPLTGEEAEEAPSHRMLAVMINNHSKARPQSGLNHADVVYEFLAEGPITRFLALYHSHIPEVAGPVRSARKYYIETAKAHDALYVYHGAANFIEEDLRAGWVDNLNGAYYDDDGFLFKRESFRNAPHNSYALLTNAHEVAKRNNIDSEKEHEWLDFYSEEELGSITGNPANQVDVRYYDNLNVSYTYDEATNTYARSADGQPSTDLETGNQLTFSNVLIYETGHQVIDDAHRRAIDRESGGKGYLIQNGVAQEIEWRGENGLMLPYIDGNQAKLVPGKTWINIIPNDPGIDQNITIQ